MNTSTAWEQFGAAHKQPDASIEIRDTPTGYAVQEIIKKYDSDSILETVLRFFGIVILLSAFGQWFLPDYLFGVAVMPMKLGLTTALGLIGFVFYWLAARGLKTQMQVDPEDRQIRLVYLNSRGSTRPQKTFLMRNLESFYVKRTKNSMLPARMYLRLRGGHDLPVARGSEAEMNALHQRMCADLQPAKRRPIEMPSDDPKPPQLFRVA